MAEDGDLVQRILAFRNSANSLVSLPCRTEFSPLSLAHECWEMEEAISSVLQRLGEIRYVQSCTNYASMCEAGDCSICLEPLFPSCSVSTACHHDFHLHCILRHLRVPNENSGRVSCPLCRMDVDEADVLNGENGFNVGPFEYGKVLEETLSFDDTIHYLMMSQASAFHVVGALGFTCMSAQYEEPETEEYRIDLKKLAQAIQCLKERQVLIVSRAARQLLEKFDEAGEITS